GAVVAYAAPYCRATLVAFTPVFDATAAMEKLWLNCFRLGRCTARAKFPAPTIPVRRTPVIGFEGFSIVTPALALSAAPRRSLASSTATCFDNDAYACGASASGQMLPTSPLKSTLPSAINCRYSAIFRFSVQRTYA